MKKIAITAIMLLFLISYSNGQTTETFGDLLYEDTLSIQPMSSWINIPDSANNIWKTGTPAKTFFDSGHSDDLAILTDTNDFYSNNRNDYFSITLPWNEHTWGEGILTFYHKYDTDSLQDGGIIEISYDKGNTWINILDDNYNISTKFIGLYEDTIIGGNYGFSGKSDGWQYVELYWHWIALVKINAGSQMLENPVIRFRFISDDDNTDKEGWMIDDIVFRGYAVTGNVINTEQNHLQIFPNPSNDYIEFTSSVKMMEGYSFKLFDINGKLVKSSVIVNQKIDISDLGAGTYFYRLQKDSEVLSGKVVKN
jgi:hypothetical protein